MRFFAPIFSIVVQLYDLSLRKILSGEILYAECVPVSVYRYVYNSNIQNRKRVLAPLGNEETSLSGIASITIDTVSFYSHVRHLHWNDKFVCRHAPRNSTTARANLVAIFRYTRRVTILEMSFTTIEWDRSRTNGLHITGLCLEGKVLFANVNASA